MGVLQFRFEIHSVLQFNLPRLHSLFRSQLWKDRNNVPKTFNIFDNLLYWFFTCIIKLKYISFIKVKCEFWNHRISRIKDFSLYPLDFWQKTVKTYRNLAKPVTPVRFSFSVKFINSTFDKLNNIYYCFLLSGAAIESHPRNNWVKNILLQINFTAVLKGFLEICTYFTIFRRVQ